MKIRFGYRRTYPIQSPMGRIISGVFFAAGVLVLLFSVYLFHQYSQIEDELVPVQAVIERIEVRRRNDDTDHDVYVSYTYQGQTYDNVRLNRYSSSMDEGDILTLNIHPDDPDRVVTNGGPIALLIGAVFTLVGGGLSLAAWRKPKEEGLC